MSLSGDIIYAMTQFAGYGGPVLPAGQSHLAIFEILQDVE